MRRKDAERLRAVELRREGWALRRIARELDVALSSVSVWVRNANERQRRVDSRLLALPAPSREPLMAIPMLEHADGLRRCGKCKLRTPPSNFGRHPQNGRQWWCKQCFRAYFVKRGQLHRDQTERARRKRQKRCYELIAERRRDGCSDCGEGDPLVLEFDHIGPKRWNISEMARDTASPRKVAVELAQCDVVCANCHRLRTFLRSGDSWRIDPEKLVRSSSLASGERRNLLYLHELLERSACVDCGRREPELFEFDHVRGKTGHVFDMARDGCSLSRLKDEIDRCEIRCANCHRRRTIQALRASSPAES